MRALVLTEINAPLQHQTLADPVPAAGEVLVRIHAAAFNHRDVYIARGLYAKIRTPVVLGSDGAGEVVALGEGVRADWLGRRVLLNPNMGWGDNPLVQSKSYQILGMPSDGTFAELVCLPADRLAALPEHLDWVQAAALPLAGLTAYRALFTRGGLRAGERVLISGIGGGVALTALQLALAAGAEVQVTSGDDDKLQRALQLGATGGVNYKNEDWHKQLPASGFDLIIDSAGGAGFGRFVDLAAPGGRIVFYGGTRGDFTLNPQKMFWKQISLLGSTMGSDADFEAMLRLTAQGRIQPVVDSVWTLEQGNQALLHLEQGKQFGKVVLTP